MHVYVHMYTHSTYIAHTHVAPLYAYLCLHVCWKISEQPEQEELTVVSLAKRSGAYIIRGKSFILFLTFYHVHLLLFKQMVVLESQVALKRKCCRVD